MKLRWRSFFINIRFNKRRYLFDEGYSLARANYDNNFLSDKFASTCSAISSYNETQNAICELANKKATHSYPTENIGDYRKVEL